MATYTELHQKDNDFEVKQFEICGQDFIADICSCVDVTTPVILTYLVDLQGIQVPVCMESGGVVPKSKHRYEES